MAKTLDIDSVHEYLGFLAEEVTHALQADADVGAIARLNMELGRFEQQCLVSSLPQEFTTYFIELLTDLRKTANSSSVVSVLIDGTVGLVTGVPVFFAEDEQRMNLLRGLKTDLEALAMRTKREY